MYGKPGESKAPIGIRWAFIGTGAMARRMAELLPAPDKVVAIGSRTPVRAAAFAAEIWPYDTPEAGDVESAMAHPDVDAVYVATPPASHMNDVSMALDLQKHVLCEKPLATRGEEVRFLLARATAAQLLLMEAMWMRFNPLIRRLMRDVQAGVVGDIKEMKCEYSLQRSPDPKSYKWRREWGGGALLDLGVYAVHLSELLLGTPQIVAADGVIGPTGVDVQASIETTHPRGVRAEHHVSFEPSSFNAGAVIKGSAGRIEISAPFFAPKIMFVHPKGVREPRLVQLSTPPAAGYIIQFVEMRRCIERGRLQSDVVPHAATMSVAKVLDDALAHLYRA